MILSEDLETQAGYRKFKIIIFSKDDGSIDLDVEGGLSIIDLYDILSQVSSSIVGRLYEKCQNRPEEDN